MVILIRKPLFWIASSLEDLKAMPGTVQDFFGHALDLAQLGLKHKESKPLQGFGGAGVLEVIEDYRGDTFRAVYTVRYFGRIYVLHVFKKKSKQGSKTPKQDIHLLHKRLQFAEEHHRLWQKSQEK